MSFLFYKKGEDSSYTDYNSRTSIGRLNLNLIKNTPMPFPGLGMYSANETPLYDDCYLEPLSAHYSSQGDCLKFQVNNTSKRGESELRQNGTANLPDHFSRYGYNAATGTCRNGYCLGNHNGRYIVGERELDKGIYGDPEGMAPESYYIKKKIYENDETYLYPSNGLNAK